MRSRVLSLPAAVQPISASQQVFDALSDSRAQLERVVELGDALKLAQWRNQNDRTGYSNPGHHTLSVYLQGGYDTRVLDQPELGGGAPGRFCVHPAEHASRWQIEGQLRFLHLYLSESAWADRIVRLLDAEPRAFTLEQRFFAHDETLAAWAVQVAHLDWTNPQQRLQAHCLSHAALDQLVLLAARPNTREAVQRSANKGGLSSVVRRRVLEHIAAHLDGGLASDDQATAIGSLSLGCLAALAHLSEFHFARMFRVSMGCSVHSWINQQRLLRAQVLLKQGRLPLTQIAAECGYASASHLSQAFRSGMGATAMTFRRASQS